MKGKTSKGASGRKAEAAIAALLLYPTIAAAAKVAGISEVTLWRWLQDPGFAARYRQARSQAVDRAMGRLQQAATLAVHTLIKVMADSAAPHAAKVSAAKTTLELAFQAIETADLQARLEALEHSLRATQPPPQPGNHSGAHRVY
jgi:hypothetical protein